MFHKYFLFISNFHVFFMLWTYPNIYKLTQQQILRFASKEFIDSMYLLRVLQVCVGIMQFFFYFFFLKNNGEKMSGSHSGFIDFTIQFIHLGIAIWI